MTYKIKRREPNFKDSTGEIMVERVYVEGPDAVELPDFFDALTDALGQVPWAAVRLHSAFLSWERPSTEEERHKHLEHQRWDAERLAAWERETYVRLKAKFERIEYSETEDMGS